MTKFFLHWFVNVVAMFVAVTYIPGIDASFEGWLGFVWLGLIFGLLNVFVRPLIKLLALPLTCLTLGLFSLVINAFMFWLVGVIGTSFGVGYTVDGFLAAMLGGIVVGLISAVLNTIFKDDKKRRDD